VEATIGGQLSLPPWEIVSRVQRSVFSQGAIPHPPGDHDSPSQVDESATMGVESQVSRPAGGGAEAAAASIHSRFEQQSVRRKKFIVPAIEEQGEACRGVGTLKS